MDAISYSYADKAQKRIKKFIANPDSTSGIVTFPKVIASGETITIPSGRMAIMANTVIDGELVIEDGGGVFIPAGATLSNVSETVTTIDDLKVLNSGGNTVEVLGYYTKGDGGGGTFYWDATSIEPDNRSTIIQANGITVGRWIKNKNITNENNSNINPMKMNDSNSYNTKILNRIGTSNGNVVQGFCIDKKNNALYTIHVSTTFVPGEEWAVINKFRNESSLISNATHSTAPSNILGHQGISIQYFNDEIKFWGSANHQVTNSGTKAIRFKINDIISDAGNSTITDIEEFKLFPYTGGGSTTPTVSSCGRYLVVEKNNLIRVFDINIFTTAGDYSNKCIHEFRVPEYGALQGLACDGNFIYILQGYDNPNENVYLSTYTLDGKLISKNTNFNIGLTNSLQDGTGLLHEPEGLCIANINSVDSLLMIVASGGATSRTARVYDCGNRDRYENYTGVELGNYHQLKYLPSIPSGDSGFDNGNKYFLLCPWYGVENKIVGKLYAGRHSSVTSHGRNWVIDITSKYSTVGSIRMSNYSIQSTTDRDTFNLVKVTYNGIEYLGIKLTDPNTPIFRAGIVFSGFESGCIFEWVNVSSITNEEAAPTYGYNKFSNDIKAPNMLSGLYMPVITGVSNVAGFTMSSQIYYCIVDKQVFVLGNFALQAAVTGAVTEFTISLPFGSNRWWRSASGNVTSGISSNNITVGVVSGISTNLSVVRCAYKATSNIIETTTLTFSYILPE